MKYKIILSLFLILLAFPLMTAVSDVEGYWTFNETPVKNSVTSSLDGTNTDVFVNTTTGIFNNSFQYNLSNSTTNISLTPHSDDYSVSFWFYAGSEQHTSKYTVLGMVKNGNYDIFGQGQGSTTINPYDSQFHHVVMVMDKTGTFSRTRSLYVDGVFVNSVSDTGEREMAVFIDNYNNPPRLLFGTSNSATESISIDELIMGKFTNSTSFSSVDENLTLTSGDFLIDEVAYYDRLLIAGEVAQLYNNGTGLPYPLSATPPLRIGEFSEFSPLSVITNQVFNLNAFWENYTSINLVYFDSNLSSYVNYTLGFSGETCVNGGITTCLKYIPANDGINLYIYNNGIDLTTTMFITASNGVGNDTQSLIVATQPQIYPDAIPESEGIGGVLTTFVNFLNSMFPDEASLTFSQKAGYVFITMLLVTITLLFATGNFKEGINPLMMYVVGVINFALLSFFISIKYISVGVIIITALVGIGISYLRVVGR